jgi:hypothetical protein
MPQHNEAFDINYLPKPKLPDTSNFENPWDCESLLRYFANLRTRHGTISLVGSKIYYSKTDLPLKNLFVEPKLSQQSIMPDKPFNNWPTVYSALDTLINNQWLVILGSPGSGKSTFIDWLTLQFVEPDISITFQKNLGPLIPVPMKLREYDFIKINTIYELINEFLKRNKADSLSLEVMKNLAGQGQLIFLLDGFDEIGESRNKLINIVKVGVKNFPKCRWILTSRSLGFDKNIFLKEEFQNTSKSIKTRSIESPIDNNKFWMPFFYMAPFSDEQIESFIKNWHQQNVLNVYERDTSVNHFMKTNKNKDLNILARTPHLLTFMALVHRVNSGLPSNRIELYDAISESYLQSLDKVNKKIPVPVEKLEVMRRLLERIAFEMQKNKYKEVSKKKVIAWVQKELEETAGEIDKDKESAETIVDYFSHRTGFLIPEGLGIYKFSHLSFQEYFAACFLQELVAKPIKTDEVERIQKVFPQWAEKSEWAEVLILLFERISPKDKAWTNYLFDLVFGQEFEKIYASPNNNQENKSNKKPILLVKLAKDSQIGLDREKRTSAFKFCWKWELVDHPFDNEIPSIFFSNPENRYFSDITNAFKYIVNRHKVSNLILSMTGLKNISFLEGLTSIEKLFLWNDKIDNLKVLGTLPKLKDLSFSPYNQKVLKSVPQLDNLENLYIDLIHLPFNQEVLEPAPHLDNLENLHIDLDLKPHLKSLENLTLQKNLETLSLFNNNLRTYVNLRFLTEFLNLKDLILNGLAIDLDSLPVREGFRELSFLNCEIRRLEFLEERNDIKRLNLTNATILKTPHATISRLRQKGIKVNIKN